MIYLIKLQTGFCRYYVTKLTNNGQCETHPLQILAMKFESSLKAREAFSRLAPSIQNAAQIVCVPGKA